MHRKQLVFIRKLKRYAAALMAAAILMSAGCGAHAQTAASLPERVSQVVKNYYGRREVKDLIFVGDSRAEGMQWLSGRYHYICKTAIGYAWLISDAKPAITQMASELPEADIILSLGVNDVDNVGSYIEEFHAMQGRYGDRVWFLSVTPVEDDRCAANGYMVNNGMINAFNEQVKAGVGNRYIDCCSYLWQSGFETQDGLHYTEDTYKKIEDFVKSTIENS